MSSSKRFSNPSGTHNAIIGTIIHSIGYGNVEIIERGMLVYDDNGVIEKVIDLRKHAAEEATLRQFRHVHDFAEKFIIPGFIDAHCHAPQYVFTGTGMDLPLLAWLEKHTFPCEARFANLDFARSPYEKSITRHLKCGTTFASYFATIHNDACKILVDVITNVGQRAFVGKVNMDRNSPDSYIEETNDGCDKAEEFVKYVLSRTEQGQNFLTSIGESVTEPPTFGSEQR